MRTLILWILLLASLRAAESVEVLVQGAENLEVEEIVAALEQPVKIAIGPFSFWTGRIGGHRIAVQLTGQALINCTTSTVLGIEEFSPKLIVNQGTSGAQAPFLTLHDIIVGRRALDYGAFVTPNRSAGQGSVSLAWVPVAQRLRNPVSGEMVEFPEGFAGDPLALAVALRTRNSMGRVFPGVIGSAHEVNLELDRVRWSHQVFGMDVEEMESGHVAAIAHAYGIRYIAFRVVSDAPYEGVPFYPQAARATGLFTVSFLAKFATAVTARQKRAKGGLHRRNKILSVASIPMTLDFSELPARDAYNWMVNVITPRPIAWVSTISAAGKTNLAPFSFFQGVCAKPPMLIFCGANDRTGRKKDSVINVGQVPEFVVNIVPYALRETMNQTSAPLPHGESEFDKFQIPTLPSERISPPRVAAAPVAFECKLDRIVELGDGPLGSSVVFGIILCLHVSESVLDSAGAIDPVKLDTIGRMGGDSYTRTTELFSIKRPG